MNWEKPELIVLTRTRSEENVLFCCKTAPSGGGAADHESGCTQHAYCGMCVLLTTS